MDAAADAAEDAAAAAAAAPDMLLSLKYSGMIVLPKLCSAAAEAATTSGFPKALFTLLVAF